MPKFVLDLFKTDNRAFEAEVVVEAASAAEAKKMVLENLYEVDERLEWSATDRDSVYEIDIKGRPREVSDDTETDLPFAPQRGTRRLEEF